MKSTDFIVARHHLQECKFIEARLPDANALFDETLLVKVDRFAFTANNITYATLGDQLKYWQLFPAPENFGMIPVWGFGEVIASRHPSIEAGERLFGYFPMATHLVIEAADVSRRGLRDAAAHRQGVAPVYNAYARIGGDFARQVLQRFDLRRRQAETSQPVGAGAAQRIVVKGIERGGKPGPDRRGAGGGELLAADDRCKPCKAGLAPTQLRHAGELEHGLESRVQFHQRVDCFFEIVLAVEVEGHCT